MSRVVGRIWIGKETPQCGVRLVGVRALVLVVERYRQRKVGNLAHGGTSSIDAWRNGWKGRLDGGKVKLRFDVVGRANIVIGGNKVVYNRGTGTPKVDLNRLRKGIAFAGIGRRRWTEFGIDVDRYV